MLQPKQFVQIELKMWLYPIKLIISYWTVIVVYVDDLFKLEGKICKWTNVERK